MNSHKRAGSRTCRLLFRRMTNSLIMIYEESGRHFSVLTQMEISFQNTYKHQVPVVITSNSLCLLMPSNDNFFQT